MDRTSLHKLISKIIVRKYKWIVDYEIGYFYNSPIEKYTIIYYTDSPNIDDKEDEVNQVEKTTENLFAALGPDRHQWFEGVEFYYDIEKLPKE
jgi:hypothetical protein